MNIRIMLYYS